MNNLVGSLLVVIGSIWVSVATCGVMIAFIGLWIVGLIWAFSSGILIVILWFLFGTAITALIIGIAATPISLLGAAIVTVGEAMKNSDRNRFDALPDDSCRECGRARVQSDDEFCRGCGHPYG